MLKKEKQFNTPPKKKRKQITYGIFTYLNIT